MKFGVRVRLEEKPARLLSTLIECRGNVVSREQLRSCLWEESVNLDFEHGLNKAVNKLRLVLGDDAGAPRYLETLSRRGYRFIGEVEIVLEPETSPRSTLANSLAESGYGSENGTPPVSGPPIAPPTLPEEESRVARTLLVSTARGPFNGKRALLVIAALALVVVLAWGPVSRSRHTGPHTIRAVITFPPDLRLMTWGEAGLAISPDGTELVFDAVGSDGRTRLWLRRLDSLTQEAIPGTEGGSFPFWSPDGKDVGFFTDLELRRVNLMNYSVVTLCPAQSGRGATWSNDGTILFARSTQTPIYRINANGGDPTSVTHLDPQRYTTHRWPVFLPDNKHFIYLAANHAENTRPGAIYLATLDSGEVKLLGEADSNVVLAGRTLLFLSHGKLISQKLNLESGTLDSHADIIAEGIECDPGSWYGIFAATASSLIYHPRPEHPDEQILSWFDARGKKVGEVGRPGMFGAVSLAPDGKTIAAICGDPEFNLCLMHNDDTVTQVTQHGLVGDLAWSSDSSTLAYTVTERQKTTTYIKELDNQIPGRAILRNLPHGISSWYPDKRHVLVLVDSPNGEKGVSILDLATLELKSYLPSVQGLVNARFSPDGKWVAYEKRSNGMDQLYIAGYPDPSNSHLVSAPSGAAPRWRGDSRELYFLGLGEAIFAASIKQTGGKLDVAAPRQLFRAPLYPVASDRLSYDITQDGTRFLVNTVRRTGPSELVLTVNWTH